MPPAATEVSNILIRDIEGVPEMRAVEELQKEVWGLPDLDVVPYSHLIAAKAAGAVLLGAFDGMTLIGFVYGFVSCENRLMLHHSHMLAVKPRYREYNIGQQLKLAQRARVLAQGISAMTWTFDPLQSLNAHFNFNKLGVVADRYLVNFYGEDAPSFLHRNGTDRLWVTWLLDDSPGKKMLKLDSLPAFEQVLPLVQLGEDSSPQRNPVAESLKGERASIDIPYDINALQQRSTELALEWRKATRWAFTEAMAAGYLVIGFDRLSRSEQRSGTYLLSRGKEVDLLRQRNDSVIAL
jgi:predicted GNAT superfamily acetyltransferase